MSTVTEAPPTGPHWQTLLFDSPASSCNQPYDGGSPLARLSARAAYQEVIFGRGVLVDIRPDRQRAEQGEVHPALLPLTVPLSLLAPRLDPRHPAHIAQAGLDRRVIVLCQEGLVSTPAAEALLRLGIHRATDVVGGFAAWRRAGLPVAS